jgi:RNA polymerase sigma-70 factor (ECF subfamily)
MEKVEGWMRKLQTVTNGVHSELHVPGLTATQDRVPRRASRGHWLSCLMRRAQEGDRVAYQALLGEVTAILKRLLRSRLGFLPGSDREDILQDILLSLHAARATYDPERPFMPWLIAIAHSRMIDNARRNSRRFANEVLIDEFPPIVADESIPADGYGDAEALHHAVRRLPRSQRTAIELLKLQELSLKEAARLSGMSVDALKVSAHRAIKALRVSLRPAAVG